MTTFLEYVAKDILDKYHGQTAHIAVVFPNKRAALFLNQALANFSEEPVWSPSYITISELFRQHSPLVVADPIKLVSDLHKSYTTITGKEEPLDTFYNWGLLLLSDFDDIDKNMADAKVVFRNLRDLHEYDDISYLSDNQKETIKRFFSHFNDQESTLQRRFLELWSRLYDIYADYHQRLEAQGLAYEGMLYRSVVEKEQLTFPHEKYLFVGFNMIQKVEQRLFRLLKQEGKAAFYWDFDHYYVSPQSFSHEAGVYLRKHLETFPNELPSDDTRIYSHLTDAGKQITLISASTEDIQARYISEWLRKDQRIEAGNKTAIVLCNESLLPTVIHCIPSEVGHINVTTGYPLQATPIASFVNQAVSLLQQGYSPNQQAFRLRYATNILRHPYAQYISEQAAPLLQAIIERKQFYIPQEELCLDEGLTELFRGGIPDEEEKRTGSEHRYETGNGNEGNTPVSLPHWLKMLVRRIARQGTADADPLFQESTFRMYTLLNRLSELINSGDLQVSSITLQRFIDQLIASTTIPFHGEPAIGLQVMGVLETRNLDFDHLLILSCNEGNMPKGVNDNSFIPHALRKAYELTTIDNKVAIYSYYFHRLLQRAKDITLVYNKATEGTSTGEMSRFVLQLMVELGTPIKRQTLQAGQIPLRDDAHPILKNPSVVARLQEIKSLSPTAINRYMRCQLLFYYNYIAGIKEPDSNDEDQVDNRTFGNIFHRAAELVYERLLPKDIITEEDIDKILNQRNSLDSIMSQAVSEELFNLPKGTTKHPTLNGLQLINYEVIETYLRQLLQIDKRLTPFRVIGHELDAFKPRIVKGRTINIGGRIDRLDLVPNDHESASGATLRVVDYKTGSRQAKNVKTMEDVFDTAKLHTHHTDYLFQAILYATNLTSEAAQQRFLGNLQQPYGVSPALLFIQHAGVKDYSPVLTLDAEPITDVARQCQDSFENLLTEKLEDIFDETTPFKPTEDRRTCTLCPYKALCGR